jgi:hypothetical protein
VEPFGRWGWGRAGVSPIARQRDNAQRLTRCAQRLRLEDSLTRRLATLNALGLRPIAAGPAGTWRNALATITARQVDNDALQVTLSAKLAYEERDDTLNCDLTGTFKKAGSEWYAGEFASQDAALARARLRLQGNTLRVVHTDDTDTNHRVCGQLAIITGTYFPMYPAGRAAASAIAARTVSPSFRCATAQNSLQNLHHRLLRQVGRSGEPISLAPAA